MIKPRRGCVMLVTALGLLLIQASPALSQGSPAAWSTVGSAGTIDEDSLALVSMGSWQVGFAAGKTGTITVRYNITAVRGLTCPGVTDNVVVARYRDTDGSGNTARMMFTINSTDVSTGGNNVVYTFDSNVLGASAGYQGFGEAFFIPFDFSTKAYWIEAKISRSSTSAQANLGPIAIFSRNNGIGCPE